MTPNSIPLFNTIKGGSSSRGCMRCGGNLLNEDSTQQLCVNCGFRPNNNVLHDVDPRTVTERPDSTTTKRKRCFVTVPFVNSTGETEQVITFRIHYIIEKGRAAGASYRETEVTPIYITPVSFDRSKTFWLYKPVTDLVVWINSAFEEQEGCRLKYLSAWLTDAVEEYQNRGKGSNGI